MSEISDLEQRYCVLSSSAASRWHGFEFQEIAVPQVGIIEPRTTPNKFIHLYQICGPMKVRRAGPKSHYQDVPTDPQLRLPDDAISGDWIGAQRGLHFFVNTETVERVSHRSFRSEEFFRLQGPDPFVEHLLRALHIDVQQRHPGGPLVGEGVLIALLHRLLGAARHEPSRAKLSPREFDCVRNWIESNLHLSISLEDLAREAGVSARYLYRAFPIETGLSPYKYILVRRVERAKHLIEAKRHSLAEIATAAGFCDQAHMAKTFRITLGVPPSHFSNRAK